MKVSDFFGRRVLDKKANEIGKVADMVIKPEEGLITSMIISTSDFGLTRKDLEIVLHSVTIRVISGRWSVLFLRRIL